MGLMYTQRAGQEIFGSFGGIVFAVLVSIACLGAIHINVFTTSRLTARAADMGYLPKFLAQIGFKARSQQSDDDMATEQPDSTSTRSPSYWESITKKITGSEPLWRTPM